MNGPSVLRIFNFEASELHPILGPQDAQTGPNRSLLGVFFYVCLNTC